MTKYVGIVCRTSLNVERHIEDGRLSNLKSPTVFFCYAWGSEERYEKLEFLRSEIVSKSRDQVEVILDRKSYSDNADFDELRDRIRKYDLVVILCTPDFKDIILDPDANKNKDREVLKEYKIIKERYDEDTNSVFPVILEGTKDSSLFEIFDNRNVRLFEFFNISYNQREKTSYVPKDRVKDFNTFLGRIIQTAHHNFECRSTEYKTTQEALDKLFGLTDTTELPDSCLVKPDLYSRIRNQLCYFVAGRKGSGKSTFIYNYRGMDPDYFDEHYKKLIPLSAEAFQHAHAYEMLCVKHRNDNKIIDTHDMLCLFWQLYFILHCFIIIRAEIEIHKIEKDDDSRFPVFDRVTKRLMRMMGMKTDGKYYESVCEVNTGRNIFNAAVEMIDEHFNKAVEDLKNGELVLTSFAAKFTVKNILENNFGARDMEHFTKALGKCKRKIMVSLDGFDTHSEDFRTVTESLSEDNDEKKYRREYETMFFRTLLEVVKQFKDHTTHDVVADAFGDIMDFCIVLPKDRYDILQYSDRDWSKKNFGTLSWSAEELMELLTKRLEYLIQTIEPQKQINEKLNTPERLSAAFSYFKGLPSYISMIVNGNTVQMSLFNYILRSSFWRPRDVISNLSKIMAQMVRVSHGDWSSDISLNQEDIKLSMKTNAEKIIDDEFIGEYKNVFHNLDKVLKELQRIKEQTDVQTFKNILKGIRFEASFSYDMDLTENKMRVLYQLGVIGLLFNKRFAKHQHYLNHICFEFNEGMAPFEEFLKLKQTDDVYVIINPIFTRRLMLDYNTTELIGNWDDEYIKANHINKEAIHGM